MKRWLIAVSAIILFFGITKGVTAQGDVKNQNDKGITFKAKITKIIEDKIIEIEGSKQPYQKLEVQVYEGENKGKKIIIENGNLPLANVVRYKPGDRLMITQTSDSEGKLMYDITDVVRSDSLLLLFIIFIILTVALAGRNGVGSIIGLAITFLIIFLVILPLLAKGWDPVIVAILGSALIIPVTFYISHGLSIKTSVAIGGTLFSLILTGGLAKLFIELSSLYGFSSEEAGLLSTMSKGTFNMKGILLAGIIIGALGVLDDITVAQAAIVQQLRESSPKIKFKEIYGRAMRVGQDHITSMVNTLILVYAGASLPLLLIFVDNPHPFSEIINYEFIAEEIVRTLTGSIGLIAAVPITTLLATMVFTRAKKGVIPGKTEESHS